MTRARIAVTATLVALSLMVAGAGAALADHEERTLLAASDLQARPYRGVVLVVVGDQVACTGFVIGRRKVATAAHCLVRDAEEGDYRLKKGVPGNIDLYRGYSAVGGAPLVSPCGVDHLWAHPRFVRGGSGDQRWGSRAHDYAVLTTPTSCRYPLATVLQMRATSLAGGELPEGRSVAIGGYPHDSRFSDMDGLHMWRSKGHIRSTFDLDRLSVSGFAGPGMSGGPLWTNHGTASPCGLQQCVVGILTECDVNSDGQCRLGDSRRLAVRITDEVKDDLRSH